MRYAIAEITVAGKKDKIRDFSGTEFRYNFLEKLAVDCDIISGGRLKSFTEIVGGFHKLSYDLACRTVNYII